MIRTTVRKWRIIPLALAFTWLPSMSARCVERCNMQSAAAHRQMDHTHQHMPTCCKVMGKDGVGMASASPSAASPDVVATASHFSSGPGPLPRAEGTHDHAAFVLPHAPPIYLRNLTLLI